jgi:hypothetical protein
MQLYINSTVLITLHSDKNLSKRDGIIGHLVVDKHQLLRYLNLYHRS